jgi:hydroxypyruvate isomerase
MPRFAANLSMLYADRPFLDRFDAAARDGFVAVEFAFPYSFEPASIRDRLVGNGLQLVLFNTVPGDADAGERGLAAVPGRECAFQDGVECALDYAQALGCTRLHAMAGLEDPSLATDDIAAGRQWSVMRDNLAMAAERCARRGVTLLIEPINRRDVPGYFLNRQADAHRLVADVAAPNLKVQMDLYHCQIVEGDLEARIRRHLPGVGHFQVAGVPQRHEPDEGEVAFDHLFDVIDSLGYDGWVGCEYRPRGDTSAGLHWLARWRDRDRRISGEFAGGPRSIGTGPAADGSAAGASR